VEADELEGWLRLSLTPGVGNGTARKLLAAFGLPPDVFAQSQERLLQLVSPAQAAALAEAPPGLADLMARTLDWLQAGEPDGTTHRILTLGDAGYPEALLQTSDPPLLLHVLGPAGATLDFWTRAIAVVGSRNPSAQGLQNARAFGRAFGAAGITVVSGLALGIDGAAHEGALDALPDSAESAATARQPATVAVVGTGLDRVYPARHHALARRIARHGLILSEYLLGTPPLAQNFPQRNRLIAALSRGTLVVEAAPRSGSLITARLAAEQGREVFAIPGSIHAPQSRGCHALIREGAKLVETVADVLEELHFESAAPPGVHAAAAAAPTDAGADARADAGAGAEPESPLLRALGFDPVSIDVLCQRTGYSTAALQARLLELELDGQVARLPGGLFQRIATG
jgi:DNA processing protein